MDVKLPKLGEGAESGTVVSVLVKEGDRVEKGQTLVELENEKAVAPVPSSASGLVSAIRVKLGDKVSVGQVILSLVDTEASSQTRAAGPPVGTESKPKNQVGPAPFAGGSASPVAPLEAESAIQPPAAAAPSIRKTARALGIDLARVRGTQAGGRIGWADLKAYVERLQTLALGTTPVPGPAPAPTVQPPSIDFSKWGPVTRKPMSPMRQTISRRMLENWIAIPHVTQFDEADMTETTALRKKHEAAYAAKGVKLTLTPLLLLGVAKALQKHPMFNASLDERSGEIVFKDYFHLGLAVDTDQGLLVPVIRDVDKKTLLQLAREVGDLAGRARERKISLEEMKGGTFTISNQGGIGGAHFTPIINKPEVAILGLGRMVLKPVVREGRVEPRMLMPVCLSYDHRLIDGASAARFTVDLLQAWQQFPEEQIRL